MSRKNRGYLDIVQESYICCENYDFLWDKDDIQFFRDLWKEGKSIFEIARIFGRKEEEVLFLIVDQCGLKSIQHRPGGIWGKEIVK